MKIDPFHPTEIINSWLGDIAILLILVECPLIFHKRLEVSYSYILISLSSSALINNSTLLHIANVLISPSKLPSIDLISSLSI